MSSNKLRKNATLNVGRVQTPTLAMLVDRNTKISGFTKEKYHLVRLDLDGISAASEKISDISDAEQMKAACHERQARLCFGGQGEKDGEAAETL